MIEIRHQSEIEDNVVELIYKFKLIKESDLYNLLNINKRSKRVLLGQKTLQRKIMNDVSLKGIFDAKLKIIEKRALYLYNFTKRKSDNYYASDDMYRQKKKIKNEEDYKLIVELLSLFVSQLNLKNIEDINIIDEYIMEFKFFAEEEFKLARIVMYKPSLKETDYIPSDVEIDNLIVLLKENTINAYKDVKIPFGISYSVYIKKGLTYLRGKNVRDLKEKI